MEKSDCSKTTIIMEIDEESVQISLQETGLLVEWDTLTLTQGVVSRSISLNEQQTKNFFEAVDKLKANFESEASQ